MEGCGGAQMRGGHTVYGGGEINPVYPGVLLP